MASYYVWSGAAGAGTGANWANAYLTLTTAFSGKVAGDIFYLAHDHSESTAGIVSLTSPGTAVNPCFVLAVNRAGSVPPVAADLMTRSAQIVSTGNNAINLAGSVIYDGVIIHCAATGGTGNNVMQVGTTANSIMIFRNSALRDSSATGTILFAFGSSSGSVPVLVEMINTTMQFGIVAHSIITQGANLLWRDTVSAISGSVFPTTLFLQSANRGSRVELRGVDLSALASGKTIVGATASGHPIRYEFTDCKLNAAVTRFAATPLAGGSEADFVRCGASGNFNVERYRYPGTMTTETTIVLTGGASDGTTPVSWKIVTTANARPDVPFETPPIVIWNATVGSAINVAVQGIWGGGAVPNDTDIWLEVEYLGDASSPQASFAHDGRATILTAGTAQAAGAGTWGGSTTKFKLDVSITAQQAGAILARVKAGAASSTFYVDPKLVVT